MSFKLTIENFGKLSNAEINIGRFTVFAGPNNTGKSSVSKLLYSLFDGMNANHALVHFNRLIGPFKNSLRRLRVRGYEGEGTLLTFFIEEIVKMENLVRSCSIDDFEEIDEQLPKLIGSVEKLRGSYGSFEKEIRGWFSNERRPIPSDLFEDILKNVEDSLNKLHADLRQADAGQFILSGIQHKILQNLIQNFQVSDLSSLRMLQKDTSKVVIDGVGTFEFRNSDFVDFDIEHAGLQHLQEYSRVIYLESPVYWKLKLALESIRLSPRYTRSLGRERISGVPGYFYDLARAIKEEYTDDIAFPEMYDKLISEKVMNGKLTLSETGDLSFREGERNFSLHLTAMGVVNLGMIALLIERKIIDKGTFLFIDEPEAHLHPAWQIKMAKTLFGLAKGGVNVVIATHSVDILKFLEVKVKKDPEAKEMIALNHFSNKRVKNSYNFDEDLANIKKELTKPFTDLHLSGI